MPILFNIQNRLFQNVAKLWLGGENGAFGVLVVAAVLAARNAATVWSSRRGWPKGGRGVGRFYLWKMLLLMELRLVVYPIIFQGLYMPGGCLGFLNHQLYEYRIPYIWAWKEKSFLSNMTIVFWVTQPEKKSGVPGKGGSQFYIPWIDQMCEISCRDAL